MKFKKIILTTHLLNNKTVVKFLFFIKFQIYSCILGVHLRWSYLALSPLWLYIDFNIRALALWPKYAFDAPFQDTRNSIEQHLIDIVAVMAHVILLLFISNCLLSGYYWVICWFFLSRKFDELINSSSMQILDFSVWKIILPAIKGRFVSFFLSFIHMVYFPYPVGEMTVENIFALFLSQWKSKFFFARICGDFEIMTFISSGRVLFYSEFAFVMNVHWFWRMLFHYLLK